MKRRCAFIWAVVWITAAIVGQAAAAVPTYNDYVKQAEQLWGAGKKLEAVQLYGSIWKLGPKDVERQILYGERSAEVKAYRWALNFLKVAEYNARDDAAMLRKVYEAYATAYNAMGYPTMVQIYREKITALRDDKRPVATVAPTPQPTLKPYYFGYYTEPPPPAQRLQVTPAAPVAPGKPIGVLKKRIVVEPVGIALNRADLGNYAQQIDAVLIGELRKTNRFIIVDPGALAAIQSEQVQIAGAQAAPGRNPQVSRFLGVQLIIRPEITDFGDQLALLPDADRDSADAWRDVPGGGAKPKRGRGLAKGREKGRGKDKAPAREDAWPPADELPRDPGVLPGPATVDRAGQTGRIRVAMDVRIYDAQSGAVVAAEAVFAEKLRSARDLSVRVSAFRWNDARSQNSTLGFATRELIQKTLQQITVELEPVPWSARVLKHTGQGVYFNAGSQDGVQEGNQFKILSVGGALTDPDTGEVLGMEEKEVGLIEVTRVEQRYAVGRVLLERDPFKFNDKVVAR